MCIFINIGLEKNKSDLILKNLPKDIDYFPSKNINFINILPSNFESFFIIYDTCSCALYSKTAENGSEVEKKKKKKYLNKGWSKSKIDRAISAKKKKEDERKPFEHGLRKDILDWLTEQSIGEKLDIFCHIRFYNGDQNNEALK